MSLTAALTRVQVEFDGFAAEVLFRHHIEHGVCRCQAHRAASIGAAQAAGERGVHQLGAAGDGC